MSSISDAVETKFYPVFNGDLEQPSLYDPRLPAIFVKSHAPSNTTAFKQKSYYYEDFYRDCYKDFQAKLRLEYQIEDKAVPYEIKFPPHYEATIHMVLRKRGGGIGFPFSSMDNAYYQEFSDKAPRWRMVARGLNLEGTCSNQACQAFNQRVVINKNMGHIPNIAKHLFSSNCPTCGVIAKEVNQLFFSKCKYTFTGVQPDLGEEEITIEGKAERTDACLRFSAEQVNWAYLAITTSSLDQPPQASNCVIV